MRLISVCNYSYNFKGEFSSYKMHGSLFFSVTVIGLMMTICVGSLCVGCDCTIDNSEMYCACTYRRECLILQKNYFYLLLMCLGPKCVYIEAVDGRS
jgi:hypothetical protein